MSFTSKQALSGQLTDPFQNSVPESAGDMERILDYGRWCPSGDNCQPWHFLKKDDTHLEIYLDDKEGFYNFRNTPLWLMAGFLIETIRISASALNYEIVWEHIASDGPKQINIRFIKKDVQKDPLFEFIKLRSVNRGWYEKKALEAQHKATLEQSLGDHLRIQWIEDPALCWEMARISALSTDIRLRVKEVFQHHKEILDFERSYSPDKIPVSTIACALSAKIMKWSMENWPRTDFMMKFMGGTLLPMVEMDYLPGLNSGAYFIVNYKNVPGNAEKIPALIDSGRSLQRFWLQLTKEGIGMQPAYAPLIFSWYVKQNVSFSQSAGLQHKAGIMTKRLEKFSPIENIVFIGRMGYPRPKLITARSVRKPLSELLS